MTLSNVLLSILWLALITYTVLGGADFGAGMLELFAVGPSGARQDALIVDSMDPVWEAFRAAHNGQWPDDVSQLQPYATTPEQQAALQKLMLKNSSPK